VLEKESRRRPHANQTPMLQRILDAAEELAQTRGFNGFSYADVAERLLVTKASLHYHFPSKADLGRALIVRYHDTFARALETIERQEEKAQDKLRRYVLLYDAVMRNDRMCLCGMLAAEYATLPTPMQDELRLFFDANERWLAAVLESGQRDGELAFAGSAKQRARIMTGALEGAMLLARTYGDGRRFQSTAKQLLTDLTPDASCASNPQRRRVVESSRKAL
jgi:TetR/AcrR family transcriptional repressor of nem operon